MEAVVLLQPAQVVIPQTLPELVFAENVALIWKVQVKQSGPVSLATSAEQLSLVDLNSVLIVLMK